MGARRGLDMPLLMLLVVAAAALTAAAAAESTDTSSTQTAQGAVDFQPPQRPVLLVPGIGGSVLMARRKGDTGPGERAWVVLTSGAKAMREHLWGTWDRTTDHVGPLLTPDDEVYALDTNHGLDGISTLDPDWVLGDKLPIADYYRALIQELEALGYVAGETLWGFPYDWRQSNRADATMARLYTRLREAYEAGGRQPVDVVTHSMGGLVMRCFLALALADGGHADARSPPVREMVHSWTAIGAPHQGAGALVLNAFIKGYNMGNSMVGEDAPLQMMLESPSAYELLPSDAFAWGGAGHHPRLVWQRTGGAWDVRLNDTTDATVHVLANVLSGNHVNVHGTETPRTFNYDILAHARETRRIMDGLCELPFPFYNVFGIGQDTPFDVTYEPAVESPAELMHSHVGHKFSSVSGDKTVPRDSAEHAGLRTDASLAVEGADHVGLLRSTAVFAAVREYVGLTCRYDGVWTVDGVQYRVAQHADGTLVGTALTSAPALRGRVEAFGRVEGTLGEVRAFSAAPTRDCMALVGTVDHVFPTKASARTFRAERTIASECAAGATQPCSVTGAVGVRACAYGVWAAECAITQCEPGYGGEACTACAVGTYKDAPGAAECAVCTNGGPGAVYVAPHSGVSSSSACAFTCDRGYSMVAGSGGGACAVCPRGMYSDEVGNGACKACTNAPDGAVYTREGERMSVCAWTQLDDDEERGISERHPASGWTVVVVTMAVLLAELVIVGIVMVTGTRRVLAFASTLFRGRMSAPTRTRTRTSSGASGRGEFAPLAQQDPDDLMETGYQLMEPQR